MGPQASTAPFLHRIRELEIEFSWPSELPPSKLPPTRNKDLIARLVKGESGGSYPLIISPQNIFLVEAFWGLLFPELQISFKELNPGLKKGINKCSKTSSFHLEKG